MASHRRYTIMCLVTTGVSVIAAGTKIYERKTVFLFPSI